MRPGLRAGAWIYVAGLVWLALTACQAPTPPSPTAARQPTPGPTLEADFELRFEYGMCFWHRLDTDAGTYQREVPGEPLIEIPLLLSETERAAIYARLLEIDFLSYPAHFTVPVPTDGIVRQVMPSYSYKLSIYSPTTMHTVEWIDDQPHSPDPAALRLRELFDFLRGLLQRLEMLTLPTPGVMCL